MEESKELSVSQTHLAWSTFTQHLCKIASVPHYAIIRVVGIIVGEATRLRRSHQWQFLREIYHTSVFSFLVPNAFIMDRHVCVSAVFDQNLLYHQDLSIDSSFHQLAWIFDHTSNALHIYSLYHEYALTIIKM